MKKCLIILAMVLLPVCSICAQGLKFGLGYEYFRESDSKDRNGVVANILYENHFPGESRFFYETGIGYILDFNEDYKSGRHMASIPVNFGSPAKFRV